jgi:transcriptional regulator with XRE-family HTH domain
MPIMKREAAMSVDSVDFGKVSGLIALIRNGDGPSLGRLRDLIGQSQSDISVALGISEDELSRWEHGFVTPNSKQMTKWRLRLSHDIDGEVSRLLGTENPDILHQFWELAWRLG